jgi:hypothetical protein
MRIARVATLAAALGLGCGSQAALAPPHDAAQDEPAGPAGPADVAADIAQDLGAVGQDREDGSGDAATSGGDAPSSGGDATSDASTDADACGGIVHLHLQWSIRTKDGMPATCAQAGADSVYVVVDSQPYKFPCEDGADQVPGVKAGPHAVTVELISGSGQTALTPSGKANPSACINDIDCVATPNCGGDICDWLAGMKCQPAGHSPKGQDGWCATDADCKCKGQGARCVVPYCTFTQPVEKILVMGTLPARDYGCGAADLGTVAFQLP